MGNSDMFHIDCDAVNWEEAVYEVNGKERFFGPDWHISAFDSDIVGGYVYVENDDKGARKVEIPMDAIRRFYSGRYAHVCFGHDSDGCVKLLCFN